MIVDGSAKIQHYIEWMYPGIISTDTSSEKIDHRDPQRVDKMKERVFAFRFFDRTVVDGEELLGKDKNPSGIYYLGGSVMTLAEVKDKYGDDPDKRILISNMENNGYDRIVMTKFGQSMPLNDQDRVI